MVSKISQKIIFILIIFLVSSVVKPKKKNNYIVIFYDKQLIMFDKIINKSDVDTIKNYDYYTNDSISCERFIIKYELIRND
jgi:hypothetical protein